MTKLHIEIVASETGSLEAGLSFETPRAFDRAANEPAARLVEGGMHRIKVGVSCEEQADPWIVCLELRYGWTVNLIDALAADVEKLHRAGLRFADALAVLLACVRADRAQVESETGMFQLIYEHAVQALRTRRIELVYDLKDARAGAETRSIQAELARVKRALAIARRELAKVEPRHADVGG